MPRSVASSSSSYDDESSSSISGDSGPNSDELMGRSGSEDDGPHTTAQPEPRQNPEEAAELAFEHKRSTFVDELVRRLCWAHYEQDQQARPLLKPRQAAAQRREFWKRCEHDDVRYFQASVASRIVNEERKMDMEHMVAAIRAMLASPIQENDHEWFRWLGAARLPPRHRLQQAMRKLVYDSLQERAGVGAASAHMVADHSTTLSENALYIASIRLLWPLLTPDNQRKLQQWIQEHDLLNEESQSASSTGR